MGVRDDQEVNQAEYDEELKDNVTELESVATQSIINVGDSVSQAQSEGRSSSRTMVSKLERELNEEK